MSTGDSPDMNTTTVASREEFDEFGTGTSAAQLDNYLQVSATRLCNTFSVRKKVLATRRR